MGGQSTSTTPQDCWIDDTRADGTIKWTLRTATAGNIGIAFRLAADNLTGFVFYRDSGGTYLLKRRAGANSYVTLTTVAGVTAAVGDVMEVVLNGSSITAKVNGVTVATATETTNQTATKKGLWSTSTTARVDNFVSNSLTG